mgnify:CR=1 FL=1|tara:strand:+ start:114 stop:788 length:675 start_codon:yes stop_codon:yes gene_type:complete
MTKESEHLLSQVKEIYSKQVSETGLGIYSDPDWNRILQAFNFADGKSILDVGIGNGSLVNMLKKSNRFDRVTGVDISKHSKLILLDDIEFKIMNILDLEFKDKEFDTIICMEVLEHLEINDFYTGLSELRRVAKDNLIITVPFREKEPVWWHDKPGGHRQSFGLRKLNSIFPLGNGKLIEKSGDDNWIMITEGSEALNHYRKNTVLSQKSKLKSNFFTRFFKKG